MHDSTMKPLHGGNGSGVARACVAVLLLGTAVQAHAVEIDLRATFSPSALNPTARTFIDVTPISGICRNDPRVCPVGGRSFDLIFDLQYGPFVVGAPAEQQATFTLPRTWRTVTLTHVETGHSTQATWRASLFGGRYVLPRPAGEITGVPGEANPHGRLWGGADWVNPPAGCSGTPYGSFSPTFYNFAWGLSAADASCSKRTNYDFESMRLDRVSIRYEMETPDPLAMLTGTYTGRLDLGIGPGQDFDFGTNATATDSQVTLNFTLEVAHDFQVVFPPAPEARLMPKGGWLQWTDYGRVPASLQQTVPFQLTSSGEFSLKMRCEHEAGTQCGIRNTDTQTVVPVQVATTLPSMHEMTTSQPAIDIGLVSEHSGQTAPRFAPRYYATGAHSSINVAVVGDPVKQMLDEGAATWQGEVTVIFDAAP